MSGVPDFCQPIIGYRSWTVDDQGCLWPVTKKGGPWLPREQLEARCLPRPSLHHLRRQAVPAVRVTAPIDMIAPTTYQAYEVSVGAPVLQCGCGYYALRALSDVRAYLYYFAAQSRYAPPLLERDAVRFVWGPVALWGTVIEHTDGYRAQFAYPAAPLWCSARAPARLEERVSDRYGVRCERSVDDYDDDIEHRAAQVEADMQRRFQKLLLVSWDPGRAAKGY